MLLSIAEILKKNEAILEAFDFCVVEFKDIRYAVVSCSIKTSCVELYEVRDEDGSIYPAKRFFETTDYISDHNKGFYGKIDWEKSTADFYSYTKCPEKDADYISLGTGDGIAVINLNEYCIEKLFYFRDYYNMPCQINVIAGNTHQNGTFVLLKYTEYSYVLHLPSYQIDVLEGTDSDVVGRFILNKPYYGYDIYTDHFYLFDVLTKQEVDIKKVFETNHPDSCHLKITECEGKDCITCYADDIVPKTIAIADFLR